MSIEYRTGNVVAQLKKDRLVVIEVHDMPSPAQIIANNQTYGQLANRDTKVCKIVAVEISPDLLKMYVMLTDYNLPPIVEFVANDHKLSPVEKMLAWLYMEEHTLDYWLEMMARKIEPEVEVKHV